MQAGQYELSLPEKRSQNTNNPWVQYGRYSFLAFLLPASAAVGYVLGSLLDRAFGTRFLYIIFLILGIAAGFIEMVREMLKNQGGQDE